MFRAKGVGNNHTLNSKRPNLEIVFLPIDSLKLHEKGLSEYVEAMRQEILNDGFLKYPIIADKNSHVILDGAHRWLALKSLGYSLIPTLLIDVNQNPKIRVGTRRIQRYNGDSKVRVRDVISAGLKRELMEPRTTRHFFPFSKFQLINCPLDLLRQGRPKNISRFLAYASEKRSASMMKDWLTEILEEINFLTQRKEEVEREYVELQQRLESLKSNQPQS